MLARVTSAVIIGTDALPVEVEVDVSKQGLTQFKTVGRPDVTLRESQSRVKAALRNIGFKDLSSHITVNLAPAELPKTGSALELPIALGVLVAGNKDIDVACLRGVLVVGEIGLDARTRPVRGAIAYAEAAARLGLKLVLPAQSAPEAALVSRAEVYGASGVLEAQAFLLGKHELERARAPENGRPPPFRLGDISDVKGQAQAKRALEIAASGGHNLLLVGPPGAGKTMLARRLPGVLPPLAEEEAFETTRVWSVAGLLDPGSGLVAERPFRAPHHTTSYAGIVGGYRPLRPGEASLATNGVLMLDEMPEFSRASLEALREPMEEGRIRLVRYGMSGCYPARFLLVGAMNPCPCGFLGDLRHECRCGLAQIERYRARLSGPLLDRIDLHVRVPRVPVAELEASESPGQSVQLGSNVQRARSCQSQRFRGLGVTVNAHMPDGLVDRFARPDTQGRRLLERAVDRYALSARGYVRVLKLARTIADLAGDQKVGQPAVAEALQFRIPEKEGS